LIATVDNSDMEVMAELGVPLRDLHWLAKVERGCRRIEGLTVRQTGSRGLTAAAGD
jgi:hypothetical protein